MVGRGLAARIGRWSLAHGRVVVAVWIALLLGGGWASASLSSHLTFRFDLPGQPAYVTNESILAGFGGGGDNPPLVISLRAAPGRSFASAAGRRSLAGLERRVSGALAGSRVASYAGTGRRAFLGDGGRASFLFVYPRVDPRTSDPYSQALPRLRRALSGARPLGAQPQITGQTILANGGGGGTQSVLVETLLAGLAALGVLGVVFGSLLALLPLMIAAIAIPTTFLLVLGLSELITMSTLVQNVDALIGLGVAIDYALLLCTRWREERQGGRDPREAALAASATAGESVLFSGVTVAVSLAALALTPVPFLRSIGLAGLFIALVSVAVALTLLPVVLARFGEALERPRRARGRATLSRFWTRVASGVVARPVGAALLALVILAVVIVPVGGLALGQPQAQATAATAPTAARAGQAQLVASGFGAGVLRPIELLVRAPASSSAGGAGSGPGAPAALAAALNQAGVSAVAPASWRAGASAVVEAWGRPDASSGAGAALLDRVRRVTAGRPGVRVGGSLAQDRDFISALYGTHLLVTILAIVVVTFLLLARALRSFWLPLKALALNAISLAAAFGVLTFLWQAGHLTHVLFASPATGAITLWVPLAVFSLLFGLSMDYEVFILTRLNEEYLEDGDVPAATVRAIGRTGRLVSSGALILFLAFIALGGVPQTDVKILSTGLAAGILIDATVVRGVLVPALIALLGRYNWYLPGWAARVLRIDTMAALLRARGRSRPAGADAGSAGLAVASAAEGERG